MHIPEIICAILKEVKGLEPEPVLEKDSFRLRNNISGQPVLTNRSTLRLVLITFKILRGNLLLSGNCSKYLFHLQLVDLLSSRAFWLGSLDRKILVIVYINPIILLHHELQCILTFHVH